MNRESFVKDYSAILFDKDSDIKGVLENADENERDLIKRGLEGALSSAYDGVAKDYFSDGTLLRGLEKGLRYFGAGLDLVGTYGFWAFGGAGFGAKFLALLPKFGADYIGANRMSRTVRKEGFDKVVSLDDITIGSETVLERAAAYLPLGIGEITDLVRGSAKFDNKVIRRAVAYAKLKFLEQYGSYMPKVPVEAFENSAYRDPEVAPADWYRDPVYAAPDKVGSRKDLEEVLAQRPVDVHVSADTALYVPEPVQHMEESYARPPGARYLDRMPHHKIDGVKFVKHEEFRPYRQEELVGSRI